MDKQMIEEITNLVMESLSDENTSKKEEQRPIKIWRHNSKEKRVEQANGVFKDQPDVSGKVKISNFIRPSPAEKKKVQKKGESQEKAPPSEEDLKDLTSQTPARIGVGRAGVRPKTNTWLQFRYDHAAAVDAVFGQVDESLLNDLDLFIVNTKVTNQETYIRRPDYGRKLSDEAVRTIKEKCKHKPLVQIIVSDGLSSKAINENLEDVYLSLQQSLNSLGMEVGTSFFIEKGRVAVMDDVGEYLQPDVIVLLIGERPGLVSAESLSAYLCYKPRHGTIESQRQVVSNIHRGGIPPVEAGAYLGGVIEKILDYEASGVDLVKKEG
ncbi:ethanolamine ammonia-lyase subunit EutC [Halobacillus sp. Marseille-Q1614]|uniref:ethanolamine ammonia-lyase subunit EutC n=1 Tax=Halobacillus sp. Marseille-Q1614 TaxID=2709134 RepID=UPI00156E5E36|nr:ethanolamine ammonia-lyase subunit EutC [Halobacillus sp. Marseille-Q1614]